MTSASTADLLLDAAERRAQTRGFNGFSYADVAEELGVTTATVHYHFAAKSDLGERLIERYTERFLEALDHISAGRQTAQAQLRAYAQLYDDVLARGRYCLCGVLSAEYETLPPGMRERVTAFFDAITDWLEAVLERGRRAGELAFPGSARDQAVAIVGALTGVMLVTRVSGGLERFRSVCNVLLTQFCGRVD